MTERPDTWMPMYWADYFADTGELSVIEHGAYFLLIGHYWRKGPLPDDDERLARIARCTPAEWKRVRSAVAGFFTVADGLWTHGRIEREWQRAANNVAKRAAAGRASAAQRKRQHNVNTCSTYVAPVLDAPLQQNARTSPSPSPREDSVAKATGAAAPLPASDQDLVWGEGLDWLASATNRKPDALRSLVGRWCQAYGATAVLAVIRDARAQSPPIVGPVPWIEAALKTRSKPNEQADEAESRRSAERVARVVARLNRKPEPSLGQLPGGDADAVLPAVSGG